MTGPQASAWTRWLRQPHAFRWRRALFQVHLWTGVAAGLYIVAISVSGSVLVYRNELRQAFEPQPRFVTVSGPRLDAEALTAAAERAYPAWTVQRIIERDDPARAATANLAERDGGGRSRQVLIDPYTGDDLGNRLPLGYRLTTWLLALHDNLLFGETGRDLNGFGSLLLTVLAATGAVVWWPGAAGWRRALGVDMRANWRRLIWTLHGAIGIWSVLFLLMWGVTGIYLAVPEPFHVLADAVEPFDEETFEPRTVDNVLFWVARVHFGRFGGEPTKAIWAGVGLLPPVLFVTGLVMWWNRALRPRERATAGERPAAGGPLPR